MRLFNILAKLARDELAETHIRLALHLSAWLYEYEVNLTKKVNIMSVVIDRKFKILAVNPCKMSRVYDETNSILLCAHDVAVPAALRAYRDTCAAINCHPEHLESIDLLIERVTKFQETNAKKPSTDTDCEIARCIDGVDV